MSNMLSGISSLGYQGTNAPNPPNLTYSNQSPTQYDSANFSLGDLWLNTTNSTMWLLVGLRSSLATWVQLNISSILNTVTGNTGGPVSFDSSNNINIIGDSISITITGDPLTNTLTASLIGGISIDTITGDTGGPVGPDADGNINILGTPNIITVTGNPGTNTLTIDAGDLVATEYDTDSGNAVPSGGILNIVGGTNINTAGSGNTVTINLDDTITGITDLTVDNLTVTNSADFSYLTQGVLQSDGSGNITSSKGTNGQVLIGSTAGAPAWANLTAGTNVTITNGANSITIAASGGSGSSGLVFLASADMTGISQYTFNNTYVTSTYKSYVLIADKLVMSAIGSLGALNISLSPNNGSSYYGGCYTSVAWYSAYNSPTFTNFSSPGGGSGAAFYPAVYFSAVSDQYISFTSFLYDITTTNVAKNHTGQYTNWTTSQLYSGYCSGSFNGATLPPSLTCNLASPIPAINAIRFSGPASFVSGTIELYGLST